MITAVKHYKRLHATTVIFLVAELLDVLTTVYALTNFGGHEGNPIVNQIGWFSASLFKLAMIIAISWFMELEKPAEYLKIVDWAFPIMAAAPVFWNIIQLAKVAIR